MNWILIGVIVLVAQKQNYATIYGMANPLPTLGPPHNLNPYIRHWEAANFNRATLEEAHQKHVQQQIRRKKRDLKSPELGPASTIRLNFFAHDREFRLVLRQDPMSVFVPDVEIENTLGPVDYDISRIYTGSLEDDDNSHVHAILTSDNLLDGTISTNSEQFYVEPSIRYSNDLPKAGVHSIVYKLSDVKMEKSISPTFMVSHESAEHCASEKLRKKLLLLKKSDFKRRRKFESFHKNDDKINDKSNIKYYSDDHDDDDDGEENNDINIENSKMKNNGISTSYRRYKRWLPDELSDNQNPPLPLDLDIPYNDDYSTLNRNANKDDISYSNSNDDSSLLNNDPNNFGDFRGRGGTARNNFGSGFDIITNDNGRIYTKTNRNRNIIINDYNPNSDVNLRNQQIHRNIIVNSFNSSTSTNFNNNNNYFNINNNNNSSGGSTRNNNINIFSNSDYGNINNNNNSDTVGISTSRPSHKTHVEIITKNGATKKPNIIVNNYSPDVILTSQNFNSHLNLNLRGDLTDSSNSKLMYDKKSTCMLYLQADHTFFQKMASDEASIEAITRHVQRANAIYRNTDFNGDGKPDNITFMIKRIKVHNMNALKDPTYRFPGNYGVEKFLELFSEEDYDAFCLAYMFTYRDFEMGTLGLAWTGDLKNAGGVCEKNGHYRGSLKSLNTGIVTLLNYGKHVPPAVSHVTLAHEIGHNFGSPHDPEQCTPGGEDGNYIMFARATSGDKRNNNKFSPCSLKSIEPVLNAKARSAKGCFTEPQQSICGNGVVEPGEQCDCGWEEDCKDSCCFPMSRHPRPDEKPCTLTPRALCSPSQGPCCTTDCSLKFGNKCRDDNGCRDPSFCDGRMPQCPPSVNKPNKTICNKEFVCYMGECTGSICLAYGLESCQCIPGSNDPKTKSCELCCKQPGEGNQCKSSFEWNEPPFDVPDMYAKPGTPCNDYNGYCDVFQKCREVDPSGPLATLRKLLLSEESIASFKKWLQTNWYTVALAFAGVILLLILSTKLLGKRSNLKLKSVTIIHSATTETVRLPEDNNGVIVHTAVRTKVPFKKKVRGQRTKKIITKTNSTAPQGANNSGGGDHSGPSKVIAGKIKKRSASGNDVPKKIGRKKNRVSAPIGAEEQQNAKLNEINNKMNKKNKKHKEVIDYSGNLGNHTNTFGKVQKWLLESPIVSQPLSHIEHSSKVRKVISKSQSTPERLVQKSPKKTKSVGNLSNEKVKLQVVYKPPFKFSLKLSKNSAVKTHVISGALNRSKRKTRNDKKRIGVAPQPSTGNGGSNSSKQAERGRRTALLIRTIEDDSKKAIIDNIEPNYETLNPKTKDNPYYENMNLKANSVTNSEDQQNKIKQQLNNNDEQIKEPKPSTSKSAKFHISRSSSNSNLDRQNSQMKKSTIVNYNRSNSVSNTTGLNINSNNNTNNNINKHSNSRKTSENSINLSRNFGSTQNLIQLSQGQIAKSKKRNSLNLKSSNNDSSGNAGGVGIGGIFTDQSRSNNINTSRHHSGSQQNLKRENSNTNLKGNLNRNSSVNNLNNMKGTTSISAATSNRDSINNIPRASLTISQQQQPIIGGVPGISAIVSSSQSPSSSVPMFGRQTSLHVKPTTISSNYSNNSINNNQNCNKNLINNASNNARPHTASCDDTRQFEWPKLLLTNNSEQMKRGRNDDPLPSDLEVMISDVENLVS